MEDDLKIHVWGAVRYGILMFFLVGTWYFFRTYELFIMMVLAIILPVISLCMLWRKWDTFGIKVVLPKVEIGKDHTVPFSIQVSNQSAFLGFSAVMVYQVKNLFTGYVDTVRERIWIAPGNSEVVGKNMLSHHMGRVEVAITEFCVNGWLGICSFRDLRQRSAWVIVGPKKAEVLDEELTSVVEGFPDENETKKRGTDINPDYEIREYIPGDDLKNIHWKLTAKTGKTMVRERLATGREQINVLLALTKDMEENDNLVDALYALGLLLLDKGYPIRLCWLGQGNLLRGHYLAEEGELVNALDEILSVNGIQDPTAARNVMEAEYPGMAYVLVKSGAFKGTYIR